MFVAKVLRSGRQQHLFPTSLDSLLLVVVVVVAEAAEFVAALVAIAAFDSHIQLRKMNKSAQLQNVI